jgi:uncharacterized protein
MKMQIEKRTVPSEVRTESAGGKTFLVGRAASYDTTSHDLGGWRECILPGAFDVALAAPDLDVVHNVNHDASKILGRSTSGTLTLSTSRRGLNYKTLLPQTGYSRDLQELVRRGDINSSSFAFIVADDGESWTDIPDPEMEGKRCALRTISKIAKLFDVSTVTNAAYPETAAAISDRSLPSSMPIELRNRILARSDEDTCACPCPECLDGDCDNCSDPDCDDEDCRCEYSMRASGNGGAGDSPTKTVDGEKLHADCFVIVQDPTNVETWHLPWKFSTEGETENHLRDALSRFDQVKGLTETEKETAWTKLVHLCKAHDIDVDDDDSRAARARLLELAMIE